MRNVSDELSGVVVVLDDAPFDDLIGAIEVMIQQGVKSFAFHASTSDLATWVSIFGARARIGVHRVRAAAQVEQAIADGAGFILPDLISDEMIAAAGDTVIYPPAMTPTEIRAVAAMPVAGVQVIPADVLGPSYAETVAELGLAGRCVPRGIAAYVCGRWFDAGAKAVIADNQLVGDALRGGDLQSLRERCENYLKTQPTS